MSLMTQTHSTAEFTQAFAQLPSSIGLMWLDDCLENAFLYANMINRAGYVRATYLLRILRFSHFWLLAPVCLFDRASVLLS
jgi:hypothetical protein